MAGFVVRPLIERADGGGQASTDDHVVACAAELFLRHGIDSVKMVDIAHTSGVGVATVYRHFSTKAAIAISAAILLWRRFNAQIRRMVESEAFMSLNGMGRMRMLLESYCIAYTAHGDFVSFVDEFDHMVVSGGLSRSELAEYGAELDSFYPIFADAYELGRMDGSIVREVEIRPFYLALAHALMAVAEKLHRGEIIPTDDFSLGSEELRCIVNMALWSLAGSVVVPENDLAIEMRG